MKGLVAAVIMELLTVFRGKQTVYIWHLREHPLGAELRSQDLAAKVLRPAQTLGLKWSLLLALGVHESALNPYAKNEQSGALGPMQLLPESRWGRAWKRDCVASPELCEAANFYWGAVALRDALDECGSEGLALGFYRTGRCVEGPRALETLELAARIRAAVSGLERKRETPQTIPESRKWVLSWLWGAHPS